MPLPFQSLAQRRVTKKCIAFSPKRRIHPNCWFAMNFGALMGSLHLVVWEAQIKRFLAYFFQIFSILANPGKMMHLLQKRLPLPHCLPYLIDAFGSTGNLTVGIHSVSQKLQVFKAWNTSIKRIVFQDKAIPKDDSNWVKLDKFNKYLILLLFALKKPACFRDFPHQTWEISAKQTKEVSDDYPWMTIRGANFMWCYRSLIDTTKHQLFGCSMAVKVQLSRRKCIPLRAIWNRNFLRQNDLSYDSKLETQDSWKKNVIFVSTQ